MSQTEQPAVSADLDRAEPQCPHFGPCGGCQLQNVVYPAQLRHKAAQLGALLDTTGLALPEVQLHPSPPYAYRNRIRLTLAEVDGQLRAGYLSRPINVKSGPHIWILRCGFRRSPDSQIKLSIRYSGLSPHHAMPHRRAHFVARC